MMGASAMAANGLLRYICGAVFPLFTTQSKNLPTEPNFESCQLLIENSVPSSHHSLGDNPLRLYRLCSTTYTMGPFPLR